MKNRSKINIKLVVTVIGIIFLFSLFSYGADFFGGSLKTNSTVITIPQGAGASSVADILKQSGAIRHTNLFKMTSKLKNADTKYVAGDFEIKLGMGYNKLIEVLTRPSINGNQNITIYEGMTVKQIAKLLDENSIADEKEFLKTCQTADFDYDFLPEKTRPNRLEGYLFPDTYNFFKDTEPRVIIDTMLKRFAEKFGEKYRQRAAKTDRTIDEIIIMASLIEAEAQKDEDRPTVAGVFYNRLKSAKSYERFLQSCASVVYILGEKKPILSLEDISIDSPYNTYKYPGLPIGPVCCPGEQAIKAALWPDDTDYMYFQSDSNGKLYFSKTLAEHESIMQKIQ